MSGNYIIENIFIFHGSFSVWTVTSLLLFPFVRVKLLLPKIQRCMMCYN